MGDDSKFVYVKHNDYGITKDLVEQGRIIDLTKGAFRQIADLKEGLIKVSIKEVKE